MFGVKRNEGKGNRTILILTLTFLVGVQHDTKQISRVHLECVFSLPNISSSHVICHFFGKKYSYKSYYFSKFQHHIKHVIALNSASSVPSTQVRKTDMLICL
jgi:hypothetical protein